MFFIRLVGVMALAALNGFFAATEFSLVAVRISRVRQLVARGSASAKIVEDLLRDLHRVVSGVQLGITIASLALGALGEATLASLFQSVWPGSLTTRSADFSHSPAPFFALALLSGLHALVFAL